MRPPPNLKPTYLRRDIKRLIENGQCDITKSATKTASALGFSETDVFDSVLMICNGEAGTFYQSITENNNNKSRQDVYLAKLKDIEIYIKLKIVKINNEHVLILSFKEDENKKGS